jgi:hypothetical protein
VVLKEWTQTAVAPVGNCWQTAIACILDVDPSGLPDQATFDRKHIGGQWAGNSYHNKLQAYLRKHHGLAQVDLHVPGEALAMLSVSGFHLITGRTIRTDERGIRHVVVGRDGIPVWDPHPSRAGLTDDIRWSLLTTYPEEWKKYRDVEDTCVCPTCLKDDPAAAALVRAWELADLARLSGAQVASGVTK